jgi:endonuclease YncB( thermonuclease family)
MRKLSFLIAGLGLLAATSAAADPCKAVPDHGAAPGDLLRRPFTGRVAYVGDGDGLCVALGPSPSAWVEVRLADFYAPELSEPGGPDAKAALAGVAMGRTVTCRPVKQSYDRIVARCELAGRSLGDLMRAHGVREGGRGR